jgi:hypothetical protein
MRWVFKMSEEDIPTQALQNARIEGGKPNATIRISFEQWNFMNKMRSRMIQKSPDGRKPTYEDIVGMLILNYDGEFS